MKQRTKIQWVSYFKNNELFEYPTFFSKLTHKKWEHLRKKAWKVYQYNVLQYKSPLRSKKMLKDRKQFFKFHLKEKQFFKIYYDISSEKKLKKNVRKSLKKKRSKFYFYSLLQQRIDSILVRVRYVPTLKIARFLVKNKFIYLNGRLAHRSDQIVKKNDILSVDFKIKKYILNNIQNKIKPEVPKLKKEEEEKEEEKRHFS